MKIIKIVRTGDLKSNEIFQESYDFEEKNNHFLVLRPQEATNKRLDKNSIMSAVAEVEMGSTQFFAMIWCFEFQESEAKEFLEDKIKLTFEKEKEKLEKFLSNLEALKQQSKTKIKKTN